MLSLEELGVLRSVELDPTGRVIVTITPTYTGCPAMDAMHDDIVRALHQADYPDVEVRVSLRPAWTSADVTAAGRRKLRTAGIAPPGPVRNPSPGPVPLTLLAPRVVVACPRCHSNETEEISRYAATACRALRRCRGCLEPFEYFKEL